MDNELQNLLVKVAHIAPVAVHELYQAPDGSMQMTRASKDIVNIYGFTAEELAKDYSLVWSRIHPSDRGKILAAAAESAASLTHFHCDWRIEHPKLGEIWVDCRAVPERAPDGGTTWYGYFHDITEHKRTEQALCESQRSLTTLLSNLPGMVYRCQNDTDWTMEFVSSGVTALTGYSAEQVLSKKVVYAELIHPDDRAAVWDQIQEAVAAKKRFQFEHRLLTADGTQKWAWEQGCGIFDAAGNLVALEGFVSDITERKASAERLALLSFALNHVQEGAYLLDDQGRIIYVNGEACRSLGYSEPELLQLNVADVDQSLRTQPHRERHDAWRGYWQQIRAEGAARFETLQRRKDGSVFPAEISGNYFVFAGQGYCLALTRDITLRKQQERDIEFLAYHDALTKLPNRSLVMNRLDQALATTQRHSRALAVLFVDLDRFKTINDTLGHAVGDLLLQQVGERFVSVVRKDDTVGRLGGDEFLVLVSDLALPEDSSQVIEKLHASLAMPFKVMNHTLHVSASIGISLYPRDAQDADTLIRYADNALYLAKEEGRNTFRYFSPELDLRIHDRLHLENDLRGALEANQLFLQYQPQICLISGVVTGLEALLRWQHPVSGLVPPDKFIPIAEDIGLITSIGEWVLRSACTQACEWHAAGATAMRIGVNLSQRQLEQNDFVEKVAQVLAETGCAPHLLELEITESSIMAHPEQAIAKLQKLHEMGVQLALDDFGTGYSSLNYLKRLPLDRLKVDKSFVAGIPDDSHDVAIVQATIVLARQLGLMVVAEGVETEEQKRFLQNHDCEEMQGYLFSRPLPAQDVAPLLGMHTPINAG